MKKVRKIISLILSVCAFVCLVSCEGDNQNTVTVDAPPSEKLVLTVATSAQFYPYEYYENEKIVGIDIDIAQLIADKLGMELEVVDVPFKDIIPAVESGKYDMGMAAITVNKDRSERVVFSEIYAEGGMVVLTKTNVGIGTLADLEGKKIAYQNGTTGKAYAEKLCGKENAVAYDFTDDAVKVLSTGEVDAFATDICAAQHYMSSQNGFKIIEDDSQKQEYAICFEKGNTELKDEVDAILIQLLSDGTIESIIDKYTN